MEKRGRHRPPPLLQHKGPFFRAGGLIAGLGYRLGSEERFLAWPSSQCTFTECQMRAGEESAPVTESPDLTEELPVGRREWSGDSECLWREADSCFLCFAGIDSVCRFVSGFAG